jgi:hypothetical protein
MKKTHVLSIAALSMAFVGSSNMVKAPNFAIDYGDVTAINPEVLNTPGTELTIYFCPRRDFLVLQDVGAVTTIDDFGVVAAAHTFTSPAGWHKLLVEMGDNSVQHEKLDSETGGAWKNSAKFMARGNAATLRGIAHQFSNDDCIFLIPLKDGTVAQIGSKHGRTRVKPGFDSGDDNSTNKRGWMFEIYCVDNYPTYYDSALAITLHS